MLVDDDIPMLRYLEKLIKWEELKINIVASTYSSVHALELFEEYQPDIVISDIGIPQMDGLQLVDKIKQLKPSTRTILVTCHEDFEYAKKAIHLEVDGYLIKDQLTKEDLLTNIKKVLHLLENESQYQEALHYKDVIDHNKDVLRQSLLNHIIEEKEEMTTDYHKSLGFDWNMPDFIVSVSQIDYTTLSKTSLSDKAIHYHHQVYRIAEQLTANKRSFSVFLDKQYNLVILYNFRAKLSENHYDELKSFLREIHREVKRQLGLFLYFYYSDISAKSSLGTVIKKLYKQRYHHFYKPIYSIYQKIPDESKIQCINYQNMVHNFQEHVLRVIDQDEEDIQEAVTQLQHTIQALKLDPIQLKKEFQENGSQITPSSNVYTENFILCEENVITLDQFIYLLSVKMEWFKEERIESNNQVTINQNQKLKEIDQYILEHLSENVTSVTMARQLHLNPSYFSRYFKQLTGENFTSYLHRFKINIAIRMLIEEYQTVEFIADSLGYSDRTYFSKVFKKHTGMSPAEYKRKKGQKEEIGVM